MSSFVMRPPFPLPLPLGVAVVFDVAGISTTGMSNDTSPNVAAVEVLLQAP